MQRFSEQLNQLVKSRKTAIYTLAEQSGVERTLIHKMLKGERVPAKRSAVEALSSALMLTPEEKSSLFQSYFASKMGENVYLRRKAVLDFYNLFPPFAAKESVREEGGHALRILAENEAVYGETQVRNLVEAVLEDGASKNEHIRIVAQPECLTLFDDLAVIGTRRKNLVIDHLVCLENSLEERNALYNLNCLRAMMPIIASGCEYRPRIYYDSISGHFGSTSIMPYLILTEEYVVRISYDASSASVSFSQPYRELYGRFFDSLMQKTVPLAVVFHSLGEEIAYIKRLYASFSAMNLDFTSDPCLLPFIGQKMVRRYMNPELLNVQNGGQIILEYMDSFPQRLKSLGTVFFSEEGIDRFLSTGRLTEVPSEYYAPLEIPDRYRILRSMYEASLSGNYHPLLADPKKLNIPANLSTYFFRKGAVCFVYTTSDREYTAFSVTENSIVSAIQDFLCFLPESNLVFSEDKTLYYLKEKLEDIPARKKA